MKQTPTLLLTVALLLATAHRLPAPIQEVPENPTPAPEQSATPKPKRTTKPKVTSESSERTSKQQTHATISAPKSESTPSNPFEGGWLGTLNNLPFAGNVEFTLVVSAAGTAVIEKSANFGTHNFQANCDGSTMRWETGSSWTLTPNPDGKTALVTCNNGGFFGVGAFSLSTVFRKITLSQAAVPSVPAEQNTLPVAKPVPERPGFVYNPFDRTTTRLFDVRGKPAGTKLKDPASGKMFIVP